MPSEKRTKIVSAKSIAAVAALLLVLTIITLLYQREKPFLPQQLQTAILFKDIPKEDLQKDPLLNASLHFLQTKAIMKGYEDQTFKPENPINRAEFVKMLTSAVIPGEIPQAKGLCFKDIKLAQWYARYACYLKEREWISGNPDGSFRPEDKIKQSEMMKILALAFGWNPADAEYKNATEKMPEHLKKNEWYTKYIPVMTTKKILTEEEIMPEKALTRKEVALSLFRAMLVDTLKVSSYNADKISDLFKVAKIPFTPEPPVTHEASAERSGAPKE